MLMSPFRVEEPGDTEIGLRFAPVAASSGRFHPDARTPTPEPSTVGIGHLPAALRAITSAAVKGR